MLIKTLAGCVPMAPRRRMGADGLTGDVAKGLENAGSGEGIQRWVIHVGEQIRHGLHALLASKHSGTGQAASGALSNHGRWIVSKRFDKGRDRVVRTKMSQALDGPLSHVFLWVVDIGPEGLVNAVGLDTTAAYERQDPEVDRTVAGVLLDGIDEVVDRFRAFIEVVSRELKLERRRADTQVVGVRSSYDQRAEFRREAEQTSPAAHPGIDQLNGASVMIDSAVEQPLRLLLWSQI